MNLYPDDFEDFEQWKKQRNLQYHKLQLQSNLTSSSPTNFQGGFTALFFISLSIYLIYKYFKLQEKNEYEGALKKSEKEFEVARQDFQERHRNLFPDSYDSTDEIINGYDCGDDDDN